MAEPQWLGINSTPVQDESNRQLDELLTEVSALAIRLKQDARRVQSSVNVPGGGHNVLRMLRLFGALTVPQIARLDSTSRQNIQTVVNRLEKQGCVESTPNPAHKRSGLLRLTDRGVAASDVVSRNANEYQEKVLAHLSQSDLTRATELLRIIRNTLCEAAAPIAQNEPKNVVSTQLSNQSQRTEGRSSKANPTRLDGVQMPQTVFEENELPISLL